MISARLLRVKAIMALALVLMLQLPSLAVGSEYQPRGFVFEGMAYNSSNQPLLDGNTTFTFRIFDPSGTCLLYEESQTNVDLNASGGAFALSVGSQVSGGGKRTGSDPGLAMMDIYQNRFQVTGNSYPGPGTCNYTPTAGDLRRLVVTMDPSSGPAETFPEIPIDSVPNALVCESIQGRDLSQLLQVNASTSTTQSNIESLTNNQDASTLHHHNTHNDARYARIGSASSQNFSGNITTTADVGIGTTSPGADLEVRGASATIRISATGGSNSSVDFYSATGSTVRASIRGSDSANTLSFLTGGIQALQLDSSQNAAFAGHVTVAGTIRPGAYDSTAEGNLVTNYLTACGATCKGTTWMNTTTNTLKFWDGDSAEAIGSGGGSSQWTTSGSDIYYNTGNIGIGVTAPTSKLTIQPSGAADTIANFLNSAGTQSVFSVVGDGSGNASLAMRDSSGTQRVGIRAWNGGDTYFQPGANGGFVIGASSTGARFEIKKSDSTTLDLLQVSSDTGTGDYLNVANSGNVGIGTATPEVKLHVATSSGGIPAALRLHNTNAGLLQDMGVGISFSQSSVNSGAMSVAWSNNADSNNTYMNFSTRGSGTVTEKMRITSDGSVGIGTTSPTKNFHVAKTGVGEAVRIQRGDDSSGNAMGGIFMHPPSWLAGYPGYIKSGSNQGLELFTQTTGGGVNNPRITLASSDSIRFSFSSTNEADPWTNPGNWSERMRITSAGNFGIATTVPDDKLHVVGQIRVDNDSNTTNKGCFRYDGTNFKLQFSHDCSIFTDLGNASIPQNLTNITDVGNASGGFTLTPMAGNSVTVNVATASTSSSTGALVVNGGAGIGGAVNVGGTVSASSFQINGTTVLRNPGTNNLFLGASSGNTNAGGSNIAIGTNASTNMSGTAIRNVAVGVDALMTNSVGFANTAIGFSALNLNNGQDNTAVGKAALQSTLGDYNTGVGSGTLRNVVGHYNTAIGQDAGSNLTSGSNNIIIGAGISAPSATGSNQLNIGNTIYGNTSTGQVGIGVTSPSAKIDVAVADGTNSTNYVQRIANSDVTDGEGNGLLVEAGNGYSDYSFRFRTRAGTDIIRGDGTGRLYAGPLGINPNSNRVTIERADGHGDTAPVFEVRDFETTNGESNGLLIKAGNGTGDYALKIQSRSLTDYMVVRGDGKVGIGTTNPTVGLYVKNNSGTGANTVAFESAAGPTTTIDGWGNLYAGASVFASSGYVHGDNIRAYSTNATMSVTANGTGNLVLNDNSTGNVGVKTASPTAALHLPAGTAAASSAPLKLTAGTNLTTPEAGAIEFDGPYLYYTDNTNTRRTVLTTSLGNSSYLVKSGDNMSGQLGVTSGTVSTGGLRFTGLGADTGIWSPATDVFAISTAGSEAMRIDTTGRVGIGTNNPGLALDVAKSNNGGGVVGVKNTDSYGYSEVTFFSSGGSAMGGVGFANNNASYFANSVYFGSINNNDVILTTDSTARLTVKNTTGNVGVGTTNPKQGLHVNDSITIPVNKAFQFNAYNDGSDRYLASDSAFEIWHDNGGDKLIFGAAAAGTADAGLTYTDVLTITSGAKVGIGDTTPDTTFKVTGSLCVKSDGNNCAGSTAGTIYANNTTVQSADYAEYFLSEEDLAPGSVVGLSSVTGLARAYRPGDRLLGVVSTNPGVVGNSDIKDKKSVLVALMGQVPFDPLQVIINGGVVYTRDLQPIGYLLASGHVYVNISSTNPTREIASLKTQVKGLEKEVSALKADSAAKDHRIQTLEDYLCSKDPNAPFCR